MEIPKYVTELTHRDWADIKRACNPINGLAVKIEKHEGDYQIGIDEAALKRIIWTLLHGGIATCGIDDIDSVPIDPGEL